VIDNELADLIRANNKIKRLQGMLDASLCKPEQSPDFHYRVGYSEQKSLDSVYTNNLSMPF